jgi:hypothetical protein
MTQPIETMTHEHAVQTMASERYLLEEMSELERHAFEEHFFSCADCADEMRTIEAMRAELRREGQAAPLPFQRRQPIRWTVAAPWAAAASLALVVGYQSLSLPADRAYAVEPVTLRAASRGEDTIVTVRPDEHAVALAIDASAPAGAGEWFYELRDSSGRLATSGRARVPSPGVPLLLVVPATTISTPGVYVLSLRDREGAPASNDYRFSVVSAPARP